MARGIEGMATQSGEPHLYIAEREEPMPVDDAIYKRMPTA
jgi:hypothetical protein